MGAHYLVDMRWFQSVADNSSTFNHANYEDQDINVAIPVFSIHGNHDDPSGVRSLPKHVTDLSFSRLTVL